MACWNALSEAQQRRLIEVGNLPIFSDIEGDGCVNGAEVAIETQDDEAPGPRFYCRTCAEDYLVEQRGYVYVAEGWWHPNAKSGKVHDHPDNPGRNWSPTSHRSCEPVYTRRPLTREEGERGSN